MSTMGTIGGTVYIVWRVSRHATKKNGRRIIAHNPERAAALWAEWHDAYSAEYVIAKGNEVTVVVSEERDGAPEHKFIVRGESRPQYFATFAE